MPKQKKKHGIWVYNMVGTSHRKCHCPSGDGTWLKHWRLATQQMLPPKCIVKGCPRRAAVGAHVKDSDSQVTPWIAPFCQYHNKRPSTQRYELEPMYTLAAAASVDCTE
jgi:hypothetical protein